MKRLNMTQLLLLYYVNIAVFQLCFYYYLLNIHVYYCFDIDISKMDKSYLNGK